MKKIKISKEIRLSSASNNRHSLCGDFAGEKSNLVGAGMLLLSLTKPNTELSLPRNVGLCKRTPNSRVGKDPNPNA